MASQRVPPFPTAGDRQLQPVYLPLAQSANMLLELLVQLAVVLVVNMSLLLAAHLQLPAPVWPVQEQPSLAQAGTTAKSALRANPARAISLLLVQVVSIPNSALVVVLAPALVRLRLQLDSVPNRFLLVHILVVALMPPTRLAWLTLM